MSTIKRKHGWRAVWGPFGKNQVYTKGAVKDLREAKAERDRYLAKGKAAWVEEVHQP